MLANINRLIRSALEVYEMEYAMAVEGNWAMSQQLENLRIDLECIGVDLPEDFNDRAVPVVLTLGDLTNE